MAAINDVLRDIRLLRGLTLRQLAAKCGIAHQTLGHYETGEVDPPLKKVIIWANALDFHLVARPIDTTERARAERSICAGLSELSDGDLVAVQRIVSAMCHKVS